MSDDGRIQTGAFSTIEEKIFTLSTPHMREKSLIFLDQAKVLKLMVQGNLPTLKVYNGRNEHAFIKKRIDDGNLMINLMVSSFT